jgi:small RNA 2'-O-methyltransferase
MTTLLHRQRLAAVMAVLRQAGARSVIDLGCGDGELLVQLAEDPAFERIAGLDLDPAAIARARSRLAVCSGAAAAGALLLEGSMTEPVAFGNRFDAAVLVEAIEHLDPGGLSRLEKSVFRELAPATVVITTPNSEYNPLLGVPAHRFRRLDHRFEWDRDEFRAWCDAVARRSGYRVVISDVPFSRPAFGGPTQMAVFDRCTSPG